MIITLRNVFMHAVFSNTQNWIGNHRSKRKRALEPERSSLEEVKPPQKIKRPNAYNVFTGDFYKSEGMQPRHYKQ